MFLHRKTARFFLVAAQFLEVLRVFGDAGEEVEGRIKYAKWKAADIVKALNEGRVPQPGPPGSPELDQHASHSDAPPPAQPPVQTRRDSDQREPSNLPSMSGTYHPHSPPAQPERYSPPTEQHFSPPPPPQQHYSPPPPPQQHFSPPPPVQQPYNPPTQHYSPPPVAANVPAQQYRSAAPVDLDPVVLADAEKHCRYATSAIQFEDVKTAIRELETAMALLRRLQ